MENLIHFIGHYGGKRFLENVQAHSLKLQRQLCLLSLVSLSITVQAQVIVTDTSTFERVSHHMRVDKTYCGGMHTLEAIFPYMQTNHYQVVENPVVFPCGEVRDNTEGGNKYIGYSLHKAELAKLGNVFDIGMSFDVATININVNFDAIQTIYPYDTSSTEYTENIGEQTNLVLPHHPHIESVANEIWAQSADIIDYARRCYEYTATHLDYIEPSNNLQGIINNGGGDCGSFTSYYVSLLRNRNIPSRHVVAVMGQDNYHVWPEFYLQNYGWIPVDPTFKHSNPHGDYFGHKNSPHYITTLGVELNNYKFAESDEPMQLQLMQLIYWCWWAYDPCTSTDFNFLIQRSPTVMVDCTSMDTSMGHVEGGGRYCVDSVAVLKATANENYRFKGWSLNGDIQSIITENPLIRQFTNDASVVAHFESESSDITEYELIGDVSIHLRGNSIIVEGAGEQDIRVFDMAGRQVASSKGNTIIVPTEGIYFVKVGNSITRKVIVVHSPSASLGGM